jgi:hypothetical protein
MADLKDEIKLVANAEGVETGVSRAKKSLATLGQAVDQVGDQGEKGFKRFGAGGEDASRRIDSSTKNMVSNLQRQIAALEAGGTANRKYQESIARMRGADMNVLKPYLDQLDAAKAKAEGATRAQQGMEKGMGTLGTAAGFLRAQMVALVGSFTFAAGVAYVRQVTDALDALNDVKDATGASIENISALEGVAMRTSTSLDVVTTSMVKLNEVLNKAKPGSDQALALKAIGLEAEELRKLDPAEALRRVAVALSNYADDGNKARLIQELFGKSVREMAPFLADLAEKTKLVGTVTAEQTAQAEALNKQIAELKANVTDAARSLVSDMLPALNATFKAMREGGVRGAIDDFGNRVFDWSGNAQRKRIANLKQEISSLTADASSIKFDVFGVRGGLEKQIEGLKAQLKAANEQYYNISPASGGGRGVVNPPAVEVPKPSVVAPESASTLNSAAADEMAARLQAFKNNDKAILDSRKAFYDTLALLSKVGAKSEMDAIEESLAKEEEVWAQRKANFDAELAEASKKKNSQAEVARITGQVADAERDHFQTVAKLRADAVVAEQKYSDALCERITKQMAAAGAAQEQVRLAQLEGKAIGLTGDALREHNQLQVEDKARRLEALALWASGVDASGKLAQAYRDEAAALRQLHAEQGMNRSAQLVNDYAKGIEESNRLLQAELGLMGQSEQARNTALEQLRIQLELEKKIAEVKALEADTPERAARISQLEASAAIAKANAANRAFLDEWKQSVNKYDDIFRQGFADMLNNGKAGWKSFTKSLATTFKTTVADQLYKAFAQPFVVNIVGNLLGLTGSLGLSAIGGAAATATGGSAVSSLGGIGSAISMGTSAFGIGASYGLQSLFANGLTGTLAAGGQMIGAGSVMSGLGTIAGALGPIALGIGALVSIANATKGETRTGGQFGVAFGGQVRNNRRDQVYTYQGQQFDRDFSNGERRALIDGQAYRLEGDPVAQESAIRDAVSGTAKGIDAFLEALGSKARLSGFSAGLETSSKDRGGVFSGGVFEDGTTFGESGKGDNYAGTLYEKFSTNSPDFKQALADFTLDLKQSTIQALQTVSDIPESVKKMLANVDAEGLTEEAANKLLESINAQIVGVNQFKAALDSMGMSELAAMSFDAAAGLAEVSGGFDKLIGNLKTYYDNFFTGPERRENLRKQLEKELKDLGLELPDINAADARQQYRAMVEAASKDTSEQGRKTYARLLELSGAFASVTEAVEATTVSLEKQRESYYNALQRAVEAENKLLRTQLSAAQEVASTLGGLFDLLHDNVRELYGEVDSTRAMQAVQGNDFITESLAAAIKTGYLPDADKLAEAIGAARGGLDDVATFGGDRAERDYAALVLAGKLSGLEKITEKQLTDAQRTVKALETQIDQNEQTLDYWKQQIEIASGTYEATVSVAKAVSDLKVLLGGTPSTDGIVSGGSGGGGTGPTGGPSQGRVSYGADEALTSFEKFKAWYQGLRNTADPNLFKDGNYKVPDWMRVSGLADDGSDEELFAQYQFFSNNRQYARDFEQVYTTGRSSFATDGSTLVKSDLTKMPPEVAEYFRNNRDALLSYEGMGMDPVLAYQLYKYGPEQFGLDRKQNNFTSWLQNNKWTAGGIVANDNVAEFAATPYADYRQNKYDSQTGHIVGMDGNLYTLDGKRVGPASQQQLDSAYGPGFKPLASGRSSLYNQQVGNGDPSAYYNALRTNLDKAINDGKSAQWIADAIGTTGASMQDVATAYGISVAELRDNLLKNGATRIPQFAVGTNYVPRDMLAVIHEGEAVVPRAYNPAAGGSASGSARLEALVAELIAKVAALEGAANATADNTGVTAGVLRSVSNNNSLYTSAPPAVFG